MRNLVIEPTSTAQWQQLVSDAEQAAHQTLNETLESYLVITLMRFSQRPEFVSDIMALEFLECQQQYGQRRQNELRDVGDKCLIFSGLFPHNAQRRLVKVSYFVNLGRSAYHQAHEGQDQRSDNLFLQLATDFVPMMDVLLAMRELNPEQRGLDLLQSLELWQDCGSQQARQTLNKATNGTIITPDDNQPLH